MKDSQSNRFASFSGRPFKFLWRIRKCFMAYNETNTPSVTRNSRHIVNPSMSRYPGINRKSLIVCKMWLWVRRETIKRGFNRQRLCSFNVPAAAEAHIHQILFKFSHTMTGNRLIQAYGVSIWNQIIEYNALCLHPSLSHTHRHSLPALSSQILLSLILVNGLFEDFFFSEIWFPSGNVSGRTIEYSFYLHQREEKEEEKVRGR